MSIDTHASSVMVMLFCLGGNGPRNEPSSLPPHKHRVWRRVPCRFREACST